MAIVPSCAKASTDERSTISIKWYGLLLKMGATVLTGKALSITSPDSVGLWLLLAGVEANIRPVLFIRVKTHAEDLLSGTPEVQMQFVRRPNLTPAYVLAREEFIQAKSRAPKRRNHRLLLQRQPAAIFYKRESSRQAHLPAPRRSGQFRGVLHIAHPSDPYFPSWGNPL